jgi:hypothetical protein
MTPYKRKPRLTVTELRSIIEFYHAYFPAWKVIQRSTLVREDSPVVQGITFERLSGGEYRPTGHIHVLVVPTDYWFLELPQDLNIKLRQINRRQHPELRDRVVEAIRAEFVPSVDRPLVAEEVLELYEERAHPTAPEAYSLAALNAYLGHAERARYWCSRFTELVNNLGRPWQDFDYQRRAFLDQLEKWLDAGDARQQLEHVLQEERRKWGLA